MNEKPSPIREPKRRGRFADFFIRLWREKPLGTACGMIVLLLILVAIFADVLAPYGYMEMHLRDRLQGSSAQYLLGTDQIGRDLLSRIIIGARLSIIVGLAATAINVVVALLIGGTSGFLGGKLDLGVQRFVDAWMAFPGLLLLLTIMSIVGSGLLQIIVVLGIAGGIVGSRVVRGAVIGVKENDYFQAAKAVGVPMTQILIRHVLPNIMPVVIIIFSINIGGVIIAEASLSFLGFGLSSDIPSWGNLLSREGRQYMEQAPWLALWPGFALTITVYSFNMFGDAMRDLLDPQAQGRPRQLRRRREETQTRLPGPNDQPFQLVSASMDSPQYIRIEKNPLPFQMVNAPKESVPFSFLRIAVFLLRQVWTIGKNQAQIIYSFFRPGFFIVLTTSSPAPT